MGVLDTLKNIVAPTQSKLVQTQVPQQSIRSPSPFTQPQNQFQRNISQTTSSGGSSSAFKSPDTLNKFQPGTYDSSTGTYTSPSGQQQSRATAPQGAVLVGGGGSSYIPPATQAELLKQSNLSPITVPTAVYNPELGGVMTSRGELYPTTNAGFIPPGYIQGQGYTVQGGYTTGALGGGGIPIKGFEDTSLGMTYGLQNLPEVIQKYRPQDIPILTRAGLLQTQVPTPGRTSYQESQLRRDLSLQGTETPFGTVYPMPAKGPSFFQRYNEAAWTTVPGLPGYVKIPSLTGTIGFAQGELGRGLATAATFRASTKPYVTLVNEQGEQISFSNQWTPEQIKQIQEGKKYEDIFPKYDSQVKTPGIYYTYTTPKAEAYKEISSTYPGALTGIALGYLGGSSSLPVRNAVSGGLLISGLEQYGTTKGLQGLKSASTVLGPAAYALPAVEIGLGAYGLRQGYMQGQLESLKKAPSLTISQPYSKTFELGGKEYQDLFAIQRTESRIPLFKGYTPKSEWQFVPGTKELQRFWRDESQITISGQPVSPALRINTISELNPTNVGGFTFTGVGQSKAVIFDPFTGGYKTIRSNLFPTGGEVIPGEGATYRGMEFKGYTAKSFVGPKVNRLRENYGGIIVSPETADLTQVFGGKVISKIYRTQEPSNFAFTTFKTTAKVKPTDFSTVLKEIEISPRTPFSLFPKSTKSQVAITELGRPLVNLFQTKPVTLDIFPATKASIGQAYPLIGKSTFQIGAEQLPKISSSVALFKFPSLAKQEQRLIQIPSSITTTKLLQVPKNIQLTGTIVTPKEIQIPKSMQSSAQSQTQITSLQQVQVPVQMQIAKQVQVPRQISIPRTVNFPTPIPPVVTIFKPTPSRKPILPKMIPTRNQPKNLFTIEFRRRGQFSPIAKVSNIQEGILIGKTASRQTLGASFRIKSPTGKTVPLFATQEFKPGKTFGTLVQIAPARLSSRGEKLEIFKARRSAFKL